MDIIYYDFITGIGCWSNAVECIYTFRSKAENLICTILNKLLRSVLVNVRVQQEKVEGGVHRVSLFKSWNFLKI